MVAYSTNRLISTPEPWDSSDRSIVKNFPLAQPFEAARFTIPNLGLKNTYLTPDLPIMPASFRYNQNADAALNELYTSARATSTQDKIRALESIQGNANFYAFGGEITDDMRLGCLEYEYLSEKELIELVLA